MLAVYLAATSVVDTVILDCSRELEGGADSGRLEGGLVGWLLRGLLGRLFCGLLRRLLRGLLARLLGWSPLARLVGQLIALLC